MISKLPPPRKILLGFSLKVFHSFTDIQPEWGLEVVSMSSYPTLKAVAHYIPQLHLPLGVPV